MSGMRVVMVQTQAAFTRGERRRFGAIIAVVLASHAWVAAHLCAQRFEPDTTASMHPLPATIRIVTLIEPVRTDAAAVPIASANETNQQSSRSGTPASPKRMAARPNVIAPAALPPRQTTSAQEHPIPRSSPRDALSVAPSASMSARRDGEPAIAPKSSGAQPQAEPSFTAPASTAPSTEKQEPSGSSAASKPQKQLETAPEASDGESAPLFNASYLHNPAPDYPPTALQHRWEGTVLLNVRVLASGSAQEVSVVESSGHASLDEAAVQAVTGWRFVPARRAGQAIDAWLRVPVVFKPE